jgi:TonB-dependent receptor
MARNSISAAIAAILAPGALLISVPVAAQQPAEPTSPPAETAPPVEETEEIVVTGFRQSYIDALNTKRTSSQITDSISSDGLGRFPDLNVGEAIQRIPGIQINREADARNATISLRGLPGTFARTTINGVGFANPVLNGSTPLGAFNSDIFTSITVIKSPTAADLAGGLSGNIDLRISPALSRKNGGFAKLSYEQNSLADLGSPQASLGYNFHVSEKLAVFGVLTYKEEKFRRDSITVNSWGNRLGAIQVGNQAAAGANPTYDSLLAQYPGGVYYPSQTRQLMRNNFGDLWTGAAGFEWQATDSFKLGTSGFYTERNLDKSLNHLLYIDAGPGNNTNTGLAATSAVAHITNIGTPYVVETPTGPRAYINQFSAANINTFDSLRSEPGSQGTWAIMPHAEFDNDTWRMSFEGTVSRAKVVSNQIELDIVQNPYRNLGTAGLNGITASVFTGGTNLANYSASLFTPNASHVPLGGYPIPATANAATQAGAQMPGAPAGTAADRFGVTGTNGQSRNVLDAAQFDIERYFDDESFLSGIQAGVRWEHQKFTSAGTRNTSLGANTAAVTQDLSVQNPYVGNFFGGNAPGSTTNWRNLDILPTLAMITPVNLDIRSPSNPNGLPAQFTGGPETGVFLTPYGLVNNYWDPNFYNNNFSNQNDVMSAYVMGKADFELGSIRVRGNAGVRYERTENEIQALDCVNCAAALSTRPLPINHSMVARNYDQTYDYWLPSAMLSADLTEQLVLRMAYYKTYVRPQPRDTVPTSSVQVPQDLVPPVDPVYTIVVGASGLKPYTSNSYDLSLEWYNRPGGLIAVAAYQKDVDDYIGPITDQGVLCPSNGIINGVDYGLGTLTINGTNCFSSNTFVGAGGTPVNARVQVTGQTNQSPIRVRGLELSVQQNFDFLPGWLSHFGGAANYSRTEIEGEDAAGNKITLPSVSKHNLNLIGYYETQKFGVRVVYNKRGVYDLAAGNSFVGDARQVMERYQIDASVSYNITDNISLSVDGFNLNDAMRAEFENDPRLPRRLDYDGRTYLATLRASF